MGDDFFLDPNPLLDDALIMRLTYDMAAGIHEADEIAVRYGFPDKPGLRRYLKNHPQIIANIRKAKALMESEEGSETRARLKAMQATEALIHTTAGIAADPRIPPQQRIDAFKQLSRVGGLDGSAAAMAGKNTGPAFTLNILFRQNPAEHINLVDVTPKNKVDSITTSSKLADIDDDEYDEEV